MTDDTMAEASAALKEAGSTVGSIASDIKHAAAQKLGEAMTEVRAKADDAKSGVADEVQGVAMALRRAAEELRGGSAQERTIGTIASTLADVSDQIRDKDLGEMVQMVKRVARENPMLFLGGAALVGFAASRYAKASSSGSGMGSGKGMSSGGAQPSPVDVFVDEGNPVVQPVTTSP
ncbi:MAG: hypothetical protein B7Z10_05405 [Rhodobacterales bacterium 32-66-7]|nr:MAG: hypothetical protein B7Z31_03495 [Rhodobacterales bacterium 12-65-15]OYX25725.1 MAG: hypothetical protein B7Z10_05405 [Rhodobacterales bacterium 32-66-7]